MKEFMKKVLYETFMIEKGIEILQHANLTAREWENWTLFFSLPIFEKVLLKNYTLHWAIFRRSFILVIKRGYSNL